jgi:hypothetical protein
VITNRLKEALRLTIDDAAVGRVAAGSSLRSEALPAGPHDLVAVGATSGDRFTARRMVGPRAAARWALQPEPARLVVSNGSSEAIAVQIDGRPYGRIEAESRGGIGGLVPGQRQVDVHGLRSGWHRSMSLRLPSGGTEVVELAPPMAVLVVENQSGEAVSIATDSVTPQTLAPSTTTPLNIPAGLRKLTTRGRTTGHVQAFDVTLTVGQSHHLLIPRARARLVVINRSVTIQTIHLGDRVLGSVQPGSEAIFEDLQPTHWWLTAYDPEGALTHSEHRRVDPGETRSWVLSQKNSPSAATQ